MENYKLTIDNKEIFAFYKNNNLDFESTNLLFLSILKNLKSNLDSSLTNNIGNQLLEKINLLSNNVSSIENNIQSILKDSFTFHNNEFINSLKLILTSNNSEQLSPLIKESSQLLLERTTNTLNELIPKNNSYLQKDIQNQISQLQLLLSSETNKLLQSSLEKSTIDHFLQTIQTSLSHSQQSFSSLVQNSNSKIESIHQLVSDNVSSQQSINQNVSEMLKKFEKGTTKGNISEHVTYNILLSLYPCAQIDHVGSEQKETGDIVLVRTNKPKILIENKDHDTKNVPKHEVEKFIRDCEIQDCCGIMMAQNRGITNKQNFEIQINNGNVLLYMHEVNFDVDKIKTAVDIVEAFKLKLDELNVNQNGLTIDKDVLEDINKEFVVFTTQKYALMKLVKDYNERMNATISEIKMPNLEKYLSSKFAFSSNQSDNICKYCEKFIPKSLLKHYRYCSAKREFDVANGIQPDPTELVDEEIEVQIPVVEIPDSSVKKSSKKKKKES